MWLLLTLHTLCRPVCEPFLLDMSCITFNRLVNCTEGSKACDTEQEVEDDEYNFTNSNVDSKNFLVNLYKNLKTSNYLNALIIKEKLDYIVISLYKNQEFSFGIKVFTDDCVREATRFHCQDDLILSYVDDEELPPLLIDVIESMLFGKCNIYYNGCIFAEIRDYRQSRASSNFFNSFFILLKPTSLSLYNDVKKIINLTNRVYEWDNYRRFKLESKLIYLTSPKLCLDPNPSIGLLSKKLSRKKLIFCNKLFLRLPRLRQKKVAFSNENFKEFKLYNFLQTRQPHPFPRFLKKNPVDKDAFNTRSHKYMDVRQVTEKLAIKQKNLENCVIEEEYLFEYVDSNICNVKLIIYFRPLENNYFGAVSYTNFEDFKGPPNINFGNLKAKEKFVDQFIQIHSNFGRKPLKVIKKVGKQPPVIEYIDQAKAYFSKNESNMTSLEANSLLSDSDCTTQPCPDHTQNNFQDNSSDLDDSIGDILFVNSDSKYRDASLIASTSPSSHRSTFSLSNQQKLSASNQVSPSMATTSSSSADDKLLSNVNICPDNSVHLKRESDNNLSVTYLQPNYLIPNSSIYSVPSTSISLSSVTPLSPTFD